LRAIVEAWWRAQGNGAEQPEARSAADCVQAGDQCLQEKPETVRYESLTDPLTTLANRKFFDQTLTNAIKDADERHEPLSLLMADIDHFKNFNDMYGT